ncbi:lipoprotein N-acyltransferase Lnb domain-containing protein [Aequorivita ciconiae]|uniref:lipoprotein N-acyltransferase Lnb domain-containing protein n=1 Tax=Aequorivita ciconiae TaxID=2494375 RepID=UPI0013E3BE34|nr:DUF4105 domain-containing protein [Aequorivita sp. H23M31]
MTKKIFLLFFLLSGFISHAQFGSLSPASEISIITIGPGTELYDKFGHSAFRIKDSLSGVDVAFNYGVYDFETPNFYTKFAQGKLLYELRVDYFNSFFQQYVSENRWVKEQVLNLTPTEKQEISDFLWNNALPENKKYKYDFFFDNCATKIRDVVQRVLGNKLEYTDDYLPKNLTFRDLIQQNLNANTWGSMGIDIALGAVIDRKAKPIEYQFLPNYIYEGAAHAFIHRDNTNEPLVKATKVLFKSNPMPSQSNFLSSPLFILGIIALLIIYITFKDYLKKVRSRYLDGIIFLFTGLIGVFLLLLWFATDHTATANNYNLLWAFPISIGVTVAVVRKISSPLLKRYVFLLLLLLALLAIHWISGVQIFAIALLPLLIALAVRYIYLFSILKNPHSPK